MCLINAVVSDRLTLNWNWIGNFNSKVGYLSFKKVGAIFDESMKSINEIPTDDLPRDGAD